MHCCRRLHSLVLGVSVGAAACAFALPAGAQAIDPVARADALFREGRDAMREHRYAEACVKFRESDELDPSPGTRLNWALCDEHTGHVVQALARARWVLDRVGADDVRRPIAAQLAEGLEKRVAWLTVRVAPPADHTARVSLDGEPLPLQGPEQARMVDPGAHVIVVDEPGHVTTSAVVSVGEGERLVRSVSPGPEQPLDHQTVSPLSLPKEKPSVARSVGYAFGTAGVVSVGAGAILGGLALGQRGTVDGHCPAKMCDPQGFDAGQRARALANASALTLGLGVACAGGAAVLLWTHKTTTASVAPVPGGAGLNWRAAF